MREVLGRVYIPNFAGDIAGAQAQHMPLDDNPIFGLYVFTANAFDGQALPAAVLFQPKSVSGVTAVHLDLKSINNSHPQNVTFPNQSLANFHFLRVQFPAAPLPVNLFIPCARAREDDGSYRLEKISSTKSFLWFVHVLATLDPEDRGLPRC
ncbi:hypothetical protein SCHPADRAFT_664131 [Schizopora paradoxa]|uniref:Uncharacterized protein n=1 Tax=Schizopora paradoxa TaxID=27342 RepID=A0A0H2R6Z5_9AGAM|nr:hypothetical protein SCHPADRAFT_664131 [Schizopora paradoxa]